MNTFPISLDYIPDLPRFGQRIKSILSEPFDPSVLKKRVLRKSKDGSSAEIAYYIDTRDLDERLDQVFTPNGWGVGFKTQDCGDRVVMSAIISLPDYGVTQEDIAEEAKVTTRKDWNASKAKGEDVYVTSYNELSAFRAAPNAFKRAAVHLGVGSYLYKFSGENTWERLDANKQPLPVEISKLPAWAKPNSGPIVALNELVKLFHVETANLDKDEVHEVLKENLMKYWGIDTLKDYNYDECIRLAACVARITDSIAGQVGITGSKYLEKLCQTNS